MGNIKKLEEIRKFLHEKNEYWWKEERPDLDLKYYVPTDILCKELAYYERGLTEEEYDIIYKQNHCEDNYFDTYDEVNYFTNLEGAEYLGGDNTYNHYGNVQNDFQWHTIKLENGDYIVLLSFHIGGDIRANYTDYIVLQFDYEVQFEEIFGGQISYENCLGFDLDVLGIKYLVTPLCFDECVEVFDYQKQDNIYGVWGNTDEDVKSTIIQKVIQEYMYVNDLFSRDDYNHFIDVIDYRDMQKTYENKKHWDNLLTVARHYIQKDNKIEDNIRVCYDKYIDFLMDLINKEVESEENRKN